MSSHSPLARDIFQTQPQTRIEIKNINKAKKVMKQDTFEE